MKSPKTSNEIWCHDEMGIFRKVETTALGNCFFSALYISGKFSFTSERDARSKVVKKFVKTLQCSKFMNGLKEKEQA